MKGKKENRKAKCILICCFRNWQSISITNLYIADGIVACKFNKPCEVEITKLGLRSTTSQLKNKAKIFIHTDFSGYSKCGKNIL
jgi:hypothetical protein